MGIGLLMLFVAAAWLLSRMMWMQRLRPLRQPHRYHIHIAAADDVITAGLSNTEEEEEDSIVRPTKLVWKSGVGWTRVPITDDVMEEEEPTIAAAAAGDNSLVIIRVEGQKSIIKRDLPLIQRGYEAAFPNKVVFGNDSSTGEGADLVLCLSLSTCFGANDADDDLPQLNRGNVIVNRIAHLRTVLWSKKSFCETVPSFVAELVSFPCWVLPDAGLDLRDLDNNEQTTKWIAKPYSSGGGRGIYVVDNAHDMREILRSDKKLVIQPFLPNPMLVNKRKVDLRVYVLVTSIVPLRAYVHSRGLVRFASQEYYATASQQQQSKSQFLTNTSINKKTSNMTAAELTWSFASLWENVGKQRARIMRMKIDRSVALILLSVESRFAQLMSSTSLMKRYHLLGVDVIFSSVETDEAKIIEVNGEPSFVASDAKEQADYAHYDESKVKVQRDVASIVLATSPPWLSTESNNKHFAATYYNELDRESQADTEFRLIYPTAVVWKHANVLDQIWALQGHNRRELHEYLTERELALFNKHCEGDDDTVRRRRKCTKPRSGQRELVFNDLSMYDDDI